MISFVNIKTGEFWDFESWDEIIKIGGLKKVLPSDEYDDIWNEDAARESSAFNFIKYLSGKSELDTSSDCEIAIMIFNNRIKQK